MRTNLRVLRVLAGQTDWSAGDTVSTHKITLTGRQLQLLRYLYGYQRRRRHSPSLADMAYALGYSTTSTPRYHLLQLQRKGLI